MVCCSVISNVFIYLLYFTVTITTISRPTVAGKFALGGTNKVLSYLSVNISQFVCLPWKRVENCYCICYANNEF